MEKQRVGSCQKLFLRVGSCQTATGSCQTLSNNFQSRGWKLLDTYIKEDMCLTTSSLRVRSCQTVSGSCQITSNNFHLLFDNFQLLSDNFQPSIWKLSESVSNFRSISRKVCPVDSLVTTYKAIFFSPAKNLSLCLQHLNFELLAAPESLNFREAYPGPGTAFVIGPSFRPSNSLNIL